MKLDAEQRRVAQTVLREARRKGLKPHSREVLAALETILVEANGRDVSHGDRDSEGAFQQRPSQGWGPASEDVATDARQFFDAARKANTGRGSAGQLAQRVQRSAFPDRYDQRKGDARSILRQLLGSDPGRRGGGGDGGGAEGPSREPPGPELDPQLLMAAQGPQDTDVLQAALGMLQGRTSTQHLLSTAKGRDDAQAAREQLEALDSAQQPSGATRQTASHGPDRDEAPRLHASGGWAGSQGLIENLTDLAGRHRLQRRGAKRTPAQNAAVGGSSTSDHLTTNKRAYAEDFANGRGEDAQKLKFAQDTARRFGVRFQKNSYDSGGVIKIGDASYKVQILYGDGIDHGDHVHVGVRRI